MARYNDRAPDPGFSLRWNFPGRVRTISRLPTRVESRRTRRAESYGIAWTDDLGAAGALGEERAGARQNAVMNGMAAQLKDADIRALAEYLAQQAPPLWVPLPPHRSGAP